MNKILCNATFDIPKMTYLVEAGVKSVGTLAACNLWTWYNNFTSLDTLHNGQKPGELGWVDEAAPRGIFAPWPAAKFIRGQYERIKNPVFDIPLTGPSGEALLLLIHSDNTCLIGKRVAQASFRDPHAARVAGQQGYVFLPIVFKLKAPGSGRADLIHIKTGRNKSELCLRLGAKMAKEDWLSTPYFCPRKLNEQTSPIVGALEQDVAPLLGLFETCPAIAEPLGRFDLPGKTQWPQYMPHTSMSDTSTKLILERSQEIAAWIAMMSEGKEQRTLVTLQTAMPNQKEIRPDFVARVRLKSDEGLVDYQSVNRNTLEKICPGVMDMLVKNIPTSELTGIKISATDRGKMTTSGAFIGRQYAIADDLSAHEKLRLVAKYGDPLHARAALSALKNQKT